VWGHHPAISTAQQAELVAAVRGNKAAVRLQPGGADWLHRQRAGVHCAAGA
jgi:hypothetical protein